MLSLTTIPSSYLYPICSLILIDFMVTNDGHDMVKELIKEELNAILVTPTRVRENGCVACDILFTLVNRMGICEAAASDQLSEVLTYNGSSDSLSVPTESSSQVDQSSLSD
jgi:hypothetical protein